MCRSMLLAKSKQRSIGAWMKVDNSMVMMTD